MTTERAIRIMSGGLILLSLALGVGASPLFVSGHFLWLTAFVGANLFQSGFTGFCPAESLMLKLGMRHGENIPASH
jgi:hypothetical protein